MEGFESVFPELIEQQEAAVTDQQPPETIAFKHDHKQLELPLAAVRAIGDTLGLSPEDAVATLQKGCNYDRLLKKAENSTGMDMEKALHTEQGWIELFMENRDLAPEDITEEMYSAVEEGRSPREVLLELRLQKAETALAQQSAKAAAAAKSTGPMGDSLPMESGDEFERAFDRALRMK